ncbi:4-alpha-glucanotransferase, partial [Candidatus Omnitrophota bacterium]
RSSEKVWSRWPAEIRDRKPKALEALKNELRVQIEMEQFIQYILFKQWFSLKEYCNHKGIRIMGDLPIYVQYNSADVWVNPAIFKLDKHKKPYVVAGVPPDYFSSTGQLWGNPLYRWDVLKENGYGWWLKRIKHNLKLTDMLRIDHFRGLVGYWEVPAEEQTAVNGKWVQAPAKDFLNKLIKRFPDLPVIAEDLGIITPDVKEVMRRFGFPGMKVLLFAFGDGISGNPYIPHNLVKECVLYTGTHDNNTARGWFEKEASSQEKNNLFEYLGRQIQAEEISWALIRLAMMSVADTVIFPIQDVLGLGQEARMNTPATTHGNWQWRLLPEQLTPEIAHRLLQATRLYAR